MTVILMTSRMVPPADSWSTWFAVTGTTVKLPPERRLADLERRLERSFMACREEWWELGREMQAAPGSEYAHAPTCGAFGSDFGIMLAWSALVAECAQADGTILAVCDDPFLFRHLATIEGVAAGQRPILSVVRAYRSVRGVLVRLRVALRLAAAAIRFRGHRRRIAPGDAVLLVYGHPESRADGTDAYFGDLMRHMPRTKRVLHTDCRAGRAAALTSHPRTAALHGWGNPLFAAAMIFTSWRPEKRHLEGRYGWLVQRAAAFENGGGGPAMNRWQHHCQRRFLKAARPARVAWPWENHGWERALCREAQSRGVTTIGYQHTVIGPHQINYSPAANADGIAAVPEFVVCDGPAYRDELIAWGVPEDRLSIGGAFRFRRETRDGAYDPEGPVFVPLSAIPAAASRQVEAARRIADAGRAVLIKDHPMYPFATSETGNLQRTDVAMRKQRGLSAVLYSTGASGFEALLAGIPAYRLLLDDRIAIDVLPAGIDAETVTVETAAEIFARPTVPASIDWYSVLADVDIAFWQHLLEGARVRPAENTPTASDDSGQQAETSWRTA